MDPKTINIFDFTYDLPENRIARYPLPQRDASRLLIYQRKRITEDVYANISHHIPPGSFLFFNDTRVIEARLLFQKSTGGVIEIFCLEPHEIYADPTTAMLQTGKILWKCLIGGASKWKRGYILEKKIESGTGTILLNATYIEKRSDHFIIEFTWAPDNLSFAEILHHAGLIPLPPYIKREVEAQDAERYQTIYANHEGSVAAPTAGLHFTDAVFKSFAEKNIGWDFLTLHVGAGTFQPVKTDRLEFHEMHGEFIEVSISIIDKIIDHLDQTIIAVGTTSLRTIESMFWLGAKIILDPEIRKELLTVNQWDASELQVENLTARNSLVALRDWIQKNQFNNFFTKTHLLITPGYSFKIIKALVTNFHQPQSTLLLLVAALVGEEWKSVYEYALENNFRFLSYGDGCLLFRSEKQ